MSNFSEWWRPQCRKCKKTFSDDRGLVDHWLEEGGQTGHYFCAHGFCMKLFPTQALAARHWVERHRPKQELECPACQGVFHCLGRFISHLEKDRCWGITRRLWDEMRTDYMAFAVALQRHDDACGPKNVPKRHVLLRFKKDKLASNDKPAKVQCPSCNLWLGSLTLLALHVEAVGSMRCYLNDETYLGVLVAQLSAGLVDAEGEDQTLKLSVCKDAFSRFMAKRQRKQAVLLWGPGPWWGLTDEEDSASKSDDAMDSGLGEFHFSKKTDQELVVARDGE